MLIEVPQSGVEPRDRGIENNPPRDAIGLADTTERIDHLGASVTVLDLPFLKHAIEFSSHDLELFGDTAVVPLRAFVSLAPLRCLTEDQDALRF